MRSIISRTTLGAALVFGLLHAAPERAEAVVFDISWVGGGGYSMTGTFSYADSLIGTGPIGAASLDSFMIEGFLGAASVGTFDLFADTPLVGSDTFNFNFDTTAEVLLVGGFSGGANGQDWATSTGGVTCQTTGFGFSSGSAAQAVCVGGSIVSASFIPIGSSTLTATRAAPEPASLALAGLGLALVAAARRRRVS